MVRLQSSPRCSRGARTTGSPVARSRWTTRSLRGTATWPTFERTDERANDCRHARLGYPAGSRAAPPFIASILFGIGRDYATMCEITRPITLTSMGMLTATNRNSCGATEARAQCRRWRGRDATPKAVLSRSDKPRARWMQPLVPPKPIARRAPKRTAMIAHGICGCVVPSTTRPWPALWLSLTGRIRTAAG